MQPVIFIKQYGAYSKGAIAGFPELIATALVKSGIARLYEFPIPTIPTPPKRDSVVRRMLKKGPKNAL